MGIIKLLEKKVNKKIIRRGEDYFKRGKVNVEGYFHSNDVEELLEENPLFGNCGNFIDGYLI